MPMNASFEIDFATPSQAKRALVILKPSDSGAKGTLSVKKIPGKPASLYYIVTAPSFAVLRARVTSLLRDLKVAQDAFEFVDR